MSNEELEQMRALQNEQDALQQVLIDDPKRYERLRAVSVELEEMQDRLGTRFTAKERTEKRAILLKTVRVSGASVKTSAQTGLYDPCFCGSGKKYKFCCRNK